MKILVLGATGAIGQQLIKALGGHPHEIYATTRTARESYGSLRYVQGNAKAEGFFENLVRQHWDVIVDFMVYDTKDFSSRIDHLLNATKQYIFTSSARVFADSTSPISESSPRLLDVSQDAAYLATDEYALSKARQENLLRASGRRNWTIIRPYITFGDGRLQLGPLEKEGWLYRAKQGRSIIFCDALMGKQTTMTDGADVACMIVALLGNPMTLGEDYNLMRADSVTWEKVLSLYSDGLRRHLGERPKVLMQDLERFSRGLPSVHQISHDRIYDRRFNPDKIGKLFELDSLSAWETTLTARLNLQLTQGTFLPLDWRAEAIRDRYAGEHARLDELDGPKQMLRYLAYRHAPLRAIMRRGI